MLEKNGKMKNLLREKRHMAYQSTEAIKLTGGKQGDIQEARQKNNRGMTGYILSEVELEGDRKKEEKATQAVGFSLGLEVNEPSSKKRKTW